MLGQLVHTIVIAECVIHQDMTATTSTISGVDVGSNAKIHACHQSGLARSLILSTLTVSHNGVRETSRQLLQPIVRNTGLCEIQVIHRAKR